MKKRNVRFTENENAFLGYEVKENEYFLVTRTNYGGQSDWPDLVRYARKMGVKINFIENVAMVKIGETWHVNNIRQLLIQFILKKNLVKASELSIQGPYLGMKNVVIKASHSIFYNWKVNDTLVKFLLKARLSLLPTNFTKYIWNREHNPMCPFCNRKTESIAHLFNGCSEFKNFYNRRHDRIVNNLFEILKYTNPRKRVSSNNLAESAFPDLREVLRTIEHRKPDIFIIDHINKCCKILEIKADLHLQIFGRAGGRSDFAHQ